MTTLFNSTLLNLFPVIFSISINPHAMILIDHFAALDGFFEPTFVSGEGRNPVPPFQVGFNPVKVQCLAFPLVREPITPVANLLHLLQLERGRFVHRHQAGHHHLDVCTFQGVILFLETTEFSQFLPFFAGQVASVLSLWILTWNHQCLLFPFLLFLWKLDQILVDSMFGAFIHFPFQRNGDEICIDA